MGPFVSPTVPPFVNPFVGPFVSYEALSMSLCLVSHAVVAPWPRSVTGQQTLFFSRRTLFFSRTTLLKPYTDKIVILAFVSLCK